MGNKIGYTCINNPLIEENVTKNVFITVNYMEIKDKLIITTLDNNIIHVAFNHPQIDTIKILKPNTIFHANCTKLFSVYVLNHLYETNVKQIETTVEHIQSMNNGDTRYKINPPVLLDNIEYEYLYNKRENDKNYNHIKKQTYRIYFDDLRFIIGAHAPHLYHHSIKVCGIKKDVVKKENLTFEFYNAIEIIPEEYEGKRFLYIQYMAKAIDIGDIYNITYQKVLGYNFYQIIDIY